MLGNTCMINDTVSIISMYIRLGDDVNIKAGGGNLFDSQQGALGMIMLIPSRTNT